MGLADALAAAKAAATKGPMCTVKAILDKLDAADRALLEAAVADDSLACTLISGALKDEGHKVNPEALRRHRKHRCACGPR